MGDLEAMSHRLTMGLVWDNGDLTNAYGDLTMEKYWVSANGTVWDNLLVLSREWEWGNGGMG